MYVYEYKKKKEKKNKCEDNMTPIYYMYDSHILHVWLPYTTCMINCIHTVRGVFTFLPL